MPSPLWLTAGRWLMLEFKDGLAWRTLLVHAEAFERNPSNVLSAAAVEEYERWLLHKNAAWSERYGGGWDRVKKLVEASARERASVRAQEVRARTILVVGLIAMVLLAAVATLFAVRANNFAVRANRSEENALVAEKSARAAAEIAKNKASLAREAGLFLVASRGTDTWDAALALREIVDRRPPWDELASGTLAAPIMQRFSQESPVPSVAFSPDGKKLVSGSGKTVRVWNADGSGQSLVLRGHDSTVTSVAFSPDGKKLVSGSEDKTVRVWLTFDPAVMSDMLWRAAPSCLPPDRRQALLFEAADEAKAGYEGCVKEFDRRGLAMWW